MLNVLLDKRGQQPTGDVSASTPTSSRKRKIDAGTAVKMENRNAKKHCDSATSVLKHAQSATDSDSSDDEPDSKPGLQFQLKLSITCTPSMYNLLHSLSCDVLLQVAVHHLKLSAP